MMNFKNSKTAKVVSGFVGLATAAMMMGPGIASAATVEELTAQINALLAQVSALQSTQSSTVQTTTSGSGYQFTSDLTVGSKGQAVTELQMILVAKGFLTMPAGVAMGYFGSLTKSAVAAWQASAGIAPAAGYVGPKSRAALNAMGGSSSSTTTTTTTTGMVPGCTSTTGFSVTTGASCATGAVVSTVPGCTSTTGFSPTTGQACSAGTTSVVPTGSGVTVALDATSPMSKTLIAGQSVATLAVFRVMNGGSTEAKVTTVKLKRTGVSADTTISNIYLYSGANRITDAASIASGVVNFNDTAGVVKIPAGGSVMLAVRADIAASTNGQTLGVMLTDVTADGVAATGAPISGAEHTIASAPSGMTTADFTTAAATPAVNTALDPQNDFTMWQENVSIGNRDASLSSIRLRQIGSVNTSDLQNFRLMVDGVQVGAAVASLDSNGYVAWNFATPVTLKTGTRVIKLVGDIVGGSNKNFQFSLRQAGDAEISDSQLGVTILPTAANAAFAAVTTGLQTISSGTLTITKTTDSLSGNVVLNGSGVALAKFDVKAQGERLKVENLRISHTASGVEWTGIRNGALFLDGVQVGSTATINEDSVATPYTQFSLGSSMVLEPGKTYKLEVRGDVYNTNTTSGTTLIAGTTTVVNIAAGSSNVQRLTSLSYISNTAVSGNTLTVAAGSIALSKYGAYASQTITSPQTAYKLAEFRLTTGSTESVNLDTFTLTHAGTITDLTNLYIVYGTKTSSIKSSSSSPLTWSVNEPLAANSVMTIAVYGNVGSGLSSGAFTGSLVVSGTSQSSGSAVTSGTAVSGQTISLGAGSISVAIDASTPVAALVVGGTMPKVGSYKFTTSNDAFTISELTFHMASGTAADAAAISELVFKDGATELKRQPMNGVNATATGLSIPVPANGTKVIDVYAQLGGIGTGFAASGANIGLALESYEFSNSAGVKTRTFGTATSTNNMYVYKTKPTITNVALPTSVLSGGTQTLYKFSIAADAGGTIGWQKINFTVATSGAGSVPALTGWALYDAADESTALSNVTVTQNAAGTLVTASSTVGVDQQISGSKTYVLKATVNGTLATGYSVSTKIAASGIAHQVPSSAATAAATATNFVWSDLSVTPHTAVTSDWNIDYLVKNLPTDSLTLTK